MRERLLARWRGVLLSLVGIVAIVWLSATGRLGLYIHPRYYEFTVVMAVIAGVIVIAAFAVLPGVRDDEADAHDHGGDHGHADPDHDHSSHEHEATGSGISSRRSLFWSAMTVLIIAGTAVALLVVPPQTLTTATVDQRDLNNSVAVADADETAQLVASDTTGFTVKDWASLLRQGAGEEYFADKSADVTGFVTPDPADPENVFYIARFVVTCCAVDAQPVGVPVYLPGWEETYAVDSWVTASGGFGPNPSTTSAQTIVLEPAEIAPTEQPAEPYVY
ncbi:TIGR03943 family protein [Herbiconiux sp. P15]|uniref:TIGR03943 family putative permease subunit n=1 Tax=Herbiconiux liukaitaii TaxID=3342799 RepID=UPI0035B9B531